MDISEPVVLKIDTWRIISVSLFGYFFSLTAFFVVSVLVLMN